MMKKDKIPVTYEPPRSAHMPSIPSPHLIYLLVDCSTSMEGQSLEQAKAGALQFATDARSRGYRVGLIRFADDARALQNPDTGFTQAVQSLTAFGTTNLAAALALAIKHLYGATGDRLICVITDGLPDSKRKALKQASIAIRQGIQIMAIGTDGADEQFLADLATTDKLSRYVKQENLEEGITDMARLLPPKNV
jgi:Mg-chelatase subunit ChlD